ncbi:MAG: hypothetical protein KDA99_25030, partial [Planctomycetales bacterium]|nr:hypothetical protein [Planctomycetales bacterium]
RGLALWIRAGICGVAHASLWLAYWWVCRTLFGTSTPELFYMVFIIPLMVAGGALGSFAAMELEWTSASLHYGMYLVITIVMRLIMGLGAFGPKG